MLALSKHWLGQVSSAFSDGLTLLFHRDRLVNLNINNRVALNYHGARSTFEGFFGKGHRVFQDDELMIVVKVVEKDLANRDRFALARSFIEHLGFSLLLTPTPAGDAFKVTMFPGRDIIKHMTASAHKGRYDQLNNLYTNMKSVV